MSKKLTAEEKFARQQEREAKRKAAKEKMVAAKKEKLSPEVVELIEKEAARIVREQYKTEILSAADLRLDRMKMQIPAAIGGLKSHERTYIRFTCEQLISIFDGWFTLNYAFSAKYLTDSGEESSTDFYICSKDVYGLKPDERPPLNKPVFDRFGIKVYGLAIIAPSMAFG